MTLADKLRAVKEAKEAIKNAIIKKGVEVLDTDTFRSYADKIESIIAGGGGGEEAEKQGLPLENIKGLCFWIDGQCNTRAGLDHSKAYMENLVWNVPHTKTSTGNAEVFGTGNVWNGDYLKLNNYAFYPQVASEQTTVEILFFYDEDRDSVTNGTYVLCNRASSSGWAIQGGSADAGRTLLLTGSDEQYRLPAREYGAINYLVLIIDTTQNKASMRILNTGEEVLDIPMTDLAVKASFNMGLGIAAGTSTSSTSSTKNRWCGLNIGMTRVWTRLLTEEEIQNNYQEVKARFGF
jgi:hypothetical protein